MAKSLDVKVTPIFKELNDSKDQFVLFYGGRSGGKSWSICMWLLFQSLKQELRIVCGRETQLSLQESVYTLLCDLIKKFGLDDYFHITRSAIKVVNGSEFWFKGFKEHGRLNIKGVESADILFIDEAQQIAKDTLMTLLPTFMRKEQGRIIFSMNRELDDDPVYEQFHNHPNCLVKQFNYYDNPFNTKWMIEEAERCKENHYAQYKHVWLGEPLSAMGGVWYKTECIQEVEEFEADYIFAVFDCAVKVGEKNDGTACILFGFNKKEQKLCIIDWDKQQIQGNFLDEFILNKHYQWEQEYPRYGGTFIEDKSGGEIALQAIANKGVRNVYPLNKNHWVNRSKSDRAFVASDYVINNHIAIYKNAVSKMVEFKERRANHLLQELNSFDITKKDQEDDLIDCLNYGIIICFELHRDNN